MKSKLAKLFDKVLLHAKLNGWNCGDCEKMRCCFIYAKTEKNILKKIRLDVWKEGVKGGIIDEKTALCVFFKLKNEKKD